MATPYFSPVRLTASSEEAAISQALLMVGASREEVEFEVLDRTEKGVTVRVSPRRENGEAAPVRTPVETPAVEAPVEAVVEEPVAEIEDSSEDSQAAAPLREEESDDADYQDNDVSDDETPDDEPVAASAPPRQAIIVDPAQVERAQSLAQEFLSRMGLDAEARLGESPAPVDDEQTVAQVFIDIEGEDVGILIGKHGQTLQSFQYLLNLTLNNRVEADDNSNVLRVIVDAGGYRSRRSQSLDQTARHAASRAKRDRRTVRLDPMPAHERRLVHIALRGDEEITTGSEGREPHRCVVITPKNAADGGGRGRGGRSGGNRFGSSGNFGGQSSRDR